MAVWDSLRGKSGWEGGRVVDSWRGSRGIAMLDSSAAPLLTDPMSCRQRGHLRSTEGGV